jgi:hypothetical protein
MHEKDGMIMFDTESQIEIVLELQHRGLNGRMIITDCGKNPRVFLNEAGQDEFLKSKGIDPDRIRAQAERHLKEQRPYIDCAKENAPGAEQKFGPASFDPKNILMNGRSSDGNGNGSTVRVVRRFQDSSYPISMPAGYLKVVEKTCADEASAEIEEIIMRELKSRGIRVAEVYRRAGKFLDLEMIAPTIYDFANTPGRPQQKLVDLLSDAIMEKTSIYNALPKIINEDEARKVKEGQLASLRRSFQGMPDELLLKHYDFFRLAKALRLNDPDNRSVRERDLDFDSLIRHYETAFGGLLREERRVHERLLSDEYTRNRGIRDGKTFAFDFTPKIDIPQIDDLLLLQAGGNNLDRDTEQRLVMMSAGLQGREQWDYYSSYVAAAPTRCYMQMAHAIDDIKRWQKELEKVHRSTVWIHECKDPRQYIAESGGVYISMLTKLIDEFVSGAAKAKQYAIDNGMQYLFGGLGATALDASRTIHNTSLVMLCDQMEDCFREMSDSEVFRGISPGIGVLNTAVIMNTYAQLIHDEEIDSRIEWAREHQRAAGANTR